MRGGRKALEKQALFDEAFRSPDDHFID